MRRFRLDSLLLVAFLTNVHTTIVHANAREELEASIQEHGAFAQKASDIGSSLAENFGQWLPDEFLAALLEFATGSNLLRDALRSFAFKSDNKIFGRYDAEFGVYSEIPELGVPLNKLQKLLDSARSEREDWENGKMSGAIYDGSQEHMNRLAGFFGEAILRDEQNKALFANDTVAQNLANTAFQHYQTSNPLHGTSFPLAVKAMRELGAMFASLVSAKHAIVNSGARESLYIALKALKKRAVERKGSEDVFAYIPSPKNRLFTEVARSLNIRVVDDLHRADFVIGSFTLWGDPLDPQYMRARGYETHLHIDSEMFGWLIQDENKHFMRDIFSESPHVVSLSFDTAGLIYSGVSALVFANAFRWRDALEAHVDWKGGIYPGLNTAGSLSGVDYIIAYVLLLHMGYRALQKLAEIAYSSFGESDSQRRQMEERLVLLNLDIFNASSDQFSGRISSGGTESIRIAMLNYIKEFRSRNYGETPIFLMTEMAHIAFQRQIKDSGGRIEFIRTQDGRMDLKDLEKQIYEIGSENIAAIVASAPSYPFGVADDIRRISVIAHKFGIGFHVDGCLGAFVTQFINGNPLQIDFRSPIWDGVTTWSADLHKYGLTQKGLSFVGYRRSFFRSHFETVCSERTAASLEVGLRLMADIGKQGYQKRAKKIAELGQALKGELRKLKDIQIRGDNYDLSIPHWVIAFQLEEPLKQHTYTLGNFLSKLGWKLNHVGDFTLHLAITNAHTQRPDFLEAFISDLQFALSLLHKYPNVKQSSTVGTYGFAASLPNLSFGQKVMKTWLQLVLSLYAENLLTLPEADAAPLKSEP